MHLRVISAFQPALVWVSLVVAAIGAATATLEAGNHCARELRAMGAASDPAQTAQVLVARNPQDSSAASREASTTTTIGARPFDELARFSARIAHEQEINLVQLQSEAISKSSAQPSQVRIRFQVRGDYADTKAFLISLLGNFPGLTLEHFTIHHGLAATPSSSATPASLKADDESTIELIQYSAPRQDGT